MVLARAIFVAVLFSFAVALLGCGDTGPGEPFGQTEGALNAANDRAAFDFFVGKGLTNFQAAGIVGNLEQESNVNPTAVQSGGPGRGIAQWSLGGRWDTDTNDNATWYATKQGLSVWSLTLQLEFIWYELQTFSAFGLSALQKTTNVTNATIAFERDFEGCGVCQQATRIGYAQAVLNAYGSTVYDAGGGKSDGGAVDAGGGTSDSGGAPSTDAAAMSVDSSSDVTMGSATSDAPIGHESGPAEAGPGTGSGDGSAEPIGVAEPIDVEGGCGCHVGGRPAPSALLLGSLLALVALRRRPNPRRPWYRPCRRRS